LDRDYKIERSTEHRAKFRADRPTELGDYAARKKKKKKISKTEVLPKTIVFGWTKRYTNHANTDTTLDKTVPLAVATANIKYS